MLTKIKFLLLFFYRLGSDRRSLSLTLPESLTLPLSLTLSVTVSYGGPSSSQTDIQIGDIIMPVADRTVCSSKSGEKPNRKRKVNILSAPSNCWQHLLCIYLLLFYVFSVATVCDFVFVGLSVIEKLLNRASHQ